MRSGEEGARAEQPLTLRRAGRVFFGQASARIISLALVATLAGRILVAGWSWWDLVAPGAIAVLHPFTEWAIHVFLLHFKPRRVGPFAVDPLVARSHRAHHMDPKDLKLVFIPLPALLGLVLGAGALWLLPAPLPLGLSALLGVYVILLTYEWTHYLIHSAYRPRHALYRYVWRAHRNHHFRNEKYWFGVTVHLADHVLGTFPERTEVPLSSTARTLGVERAA